MASPFFSGRIPQSLFDKVEEFIKESGKTKTEILIEALAAYLSYPIETKKPIGDEEVWNAIRELIERVKTLEENAEKSAKTSSNNTAKEKAEESLNQLSLLEEQKPMTKTEERILKTSEIPGLPGLERMNRTKILNKLRNAKTKGHRTIQIGKYLFTYVRQEPGTKGALVWGVKDI